MYGSGGGNLLRVHLNNRGIPTNVTFTGTCDSATLRFTSKLKFVILATPRVNSRDWCLIRIADVLFVSKVIYKRQYKTKHYWTTLFGSYWGNDGLILFCKFMAPWFMILQKREITNLSQNIYVLLWIVEINAPTDLPLIL